MLGKPRARHLLFGIRLLTETASPITPATLPPFVAAFEEMRARIIAKENGEKASSKQSVASGKQLVYAVSMRPRVVSSKQ